MVPHVTLTVTQGPLKGREFVFYDPLLFTVGRGGDCYLPLPGDLANLDVSRHHCLLDIDPPMVHVKDLGSRNGTYVNEVCIGQRPRGVTAEAVIPLDGDEHELHDGDELRVGGTVFRVALAGAEAEGDSLPPGSGSFCEELVPAGCAD